MTPEEKYPYAVYGIDNWKINRDSKSSDRYGWTDHIWRAYDYPHVVYLYWSMYQIAKHYPELSHYADKKRISSTCLRYRAGVLHLSLADRALVTRMNWEITMRWSSPTS